MFRVPALNGFNWSLSAIFLALIVAVLVQVVEFAPWRRQHYALATCEPRGFPVHAWGALARAERPLLSFDTRMPNSEMELWGEPSWLAEGDRLEFPDRIDVQFVSLQERRYYRGSFVLPTEAIAQAYERAQRDGKLVTISKQKAAGEYRKGLTFALCFANDGGVAMWLRGADFQQTLFKTRLKAETPPTGALDFGRPMALDQFISERFLGYDSAESRAYLRSFDDSRDWLKAPTGWPEKNPDPEGTLR